jgi:hypothetical protein
VKHLLLLALSIAPLVQDGARERVRNAVASYISPRTRAEERTRIVERLGTMGPAAVGFVQAVGDGTGPGPMFLPTRFLAGEVKVDVLRRVADEDGAQAILKIRAMNGKVDLSDASLESILDELRRQGLSQVLVNPAEQDEIAKLRFTVRANGEPVDQILDRLLQKQRLDYYARGGVLIIASRSWLWGPPSSAAPDAALQARVTEALGQLDSEMLDRRAAAERSIIDAGPGAISILEQARAGSTKKDRLDVLVDRIYSRHVPDRLHPLSAEPGLISEEAHEFHRSARERPVSISFFRPTPLSEIVARISEFAETPVAFDPSLAAAITGRKLTLAADRGGVHPILEALVVPLGAAVKPEAGRYLIVPRP